MQWPHVLAHLRRAAAALRHRGPVIVSDAQIGGRVSEVLKGMTRGEAEARGIVDRIKASIHRNDAA